MFPVDVGGKREAVVEEHKVGRATRIGFDRPRVRSVCHPAEMGVTGSDTVFNLYTLPYRQGAAEAVSGIWATSLVLLMVSCVVQLDE